MRPTFNQFGPFYRLQLRLGLLSEDDLAAGRRALLFVGLAWIPAVLLAAVEGVALHPQHDKALLLDFSIYAFAIAIGAFVLMEQSADKRMAHLVGQFESRGIATESSLGQLFRARERMERRTGSWMAELAILVLAFALSWFWITKAVTIAQGDAWHGRMVDGIPSPTLAGWWALLFAMPLYWFLFGRWVWRFATWGLLLRDIARCDLRLVATHPDRCGGLAFMGHYPMAYTLFVFAESTVVSATVLKLIVHGNAELMGFKFALLGLIAFFAIALVLPLPVFTPKLVALKRRALDHYGTLASRHNLAFESKWIGPPPQEPAEEMLGSPDPSSLADFAGGYELASTDLIIFAHFASSANKNRLQLEFLQH